MSDPKFLLFPGYSCGACVAAAVLDLENVHLAGYVGISFPMGVLSCSFLRTQDSFLKLAKSSIPKLLVMGNADQYTSDARMKRLVAELNKRISQRNSESVRQGALGVEEQSCESWKAVELRVVDGADHFWGDTVDDWNILADLVFRWIIDQQREVHAAHTAKTTRES